MIASMIAPMVASVAAAVFINALTCAPIVLRTVPAIMLPVRAILVLQVLAALTVVVFLTR